MTRKTLLAGLICTGLVLAMVLLFRSPEKGAHPVEERPPPAAKIGAGEVETLEITRKSGTMVVRREGDKFFIVKPKAYPAEANGAILAFEGIEKMAWGHVVSERKDRHEEFELGDDSVRVVAKKGDRVLLDIRVGKTTKLRTMVRLEGRDEVWSVSNLMKYMVDRDLVDWRHKSLVTFDQKDPVKLVVMARDGTKIVLHRPARGDGGVPSQWRLAESVPRMDRFDSDMVTAALTQLANWKANDYADDVTAEEAGLDRPDLTVAVGLPGDREITVFLGKKKGEDDVYVRMTGDPQIYLMKKWNLDRMGKRPSDYRDKVICDMPAAEIGEVSVTRDKDSYTLERRGEAFVLSGPEGITPDPSKVSDILGAFTNWKGQHFAEPTKATGLARPSAVISVKSRAGERRCYVKVGGIAAEKFNVYVQLERQPDALVASKLPVDRVLVKLDALKKK